MRKKPRISDSGAGDDVGDHLGSLQRVGVDQLGEPPQERDVLLTAFTLGPAGELRIADRDQQVESVLNGGAARELAFVDLQRAVAVVGDVAPIGEQERDLALLNALLLDAERPRDR